MKAKYLFIIAFAAILVAGCKKNEKPLSPSDQKDALEGMGMELIEYADVENWGEAFKAVAQFGTAVTDKENDQSVFEALTESIETEEESGSDDNDTEYGWYCSYQEPGEFIHERVNTVQLANAKGNITLDAGKKAWVKADAPSLSITADVDGTPMTAKVEVKTSSTKTLITESRSESYNEWPAYTTGPAMYCEKVKHEQETYTYYSWEPVTRTTGGDTEYHFYNPVTKQDYGWLSQAQISNDYITYMNIVSVPAGKQSRVNVNKGYLFMPQSITASFLKGGDSVGDLDVTIDYKPASAGTLDIAKDQVDVSFSFMASGYTLRTKKLNYLTDGAEASYIFSYGKKDILTMTAVEQGFKLSSEKRENRSENDNGNGYKNGYINTRTTYDVSSMPKSVEISLDLLGELQVKGTADVEKLVECSAKMEEARQNENEFKNWLAQAEQAISLKAFYDSKKCSAYLGLEPEKNEAGEWNVIPVIRFEDGSAFAMFEDFFNKTDFADLIQAFENWQKSVDNYISSVLNDKK